MIHEKNILTVEDVMNYTGFSQKQIYKLTSTRTIPHYKPSGRKFFLKKIKSMNGSLKGGYIPFQS